jgi:serine/threonine protein kinase
LFCYSAIGWALDIASGLAVLAKNGIVHRDLRSGTILLTAIGSFIVHVVLLLTWKIGM